MSIITSASSKSYSRGLSYYKEDRVKKLKKINDYEYTSVVEGTEKYNVYLNLDKTSKSTCNCPLANGKRIICKHIVATYFKVDPETARECEEEQERLRIKYEVEYNKQQKKLNNCLKRMTKEQLIDEIKYLLEFAPDWVYDEFMTRND